MTEQPTEQPNPNGKMKVFVHLARGFGRDAWKRRWERGDLLGINHDNPYGYRQAEEMGCEITQSEDLPENAVSRLFRLGIRAILGFDLAHAWRNRKQIFAAEVVWTHTESQSLAVLALLHLRSSSTTKPKVIAQTVWVMDSWDSYSSLRRKLYRHLLEKADLLTFLSTCAAARAKQLFPNKRVVFVKYGIRADQSLDKERHSHDPVHVLTLGNDRHRDWPTFVAALKDNPRYEARAVTRADLASLLSGVHNVAQERVKTNAELVALFDWADLAVICLTQNLHASGITVIEEAVLCGIPVICSDAGDLLSYFPSDEITYVRPENPSALRQAIDELLADDSLRLSKAKKALARMKNGDLNSWSFVQHHVDLSRALLNDAQEVPGEIL